MVYRKVVLKTSVCFDRIDGGDVMGILELDEQFKSPVTFFFISLINHLQYKFK